jgi:hypothetical protein
MLAVITYAGSVEMESEDAICHTENNLLMYLLFTARRVAAGESINKRTLTRSTPQTQHTLLFHTAHIIICYSAPLLV